MMLIGFRIFAFLTLCGCCFGAITIKPRIIGGEYAEIDDFPFQLSLKYYNVHACGASILSARRALTAAHCVFDYVYVENYTVTAGSIMKQPNTNENIQVIKILSHPYFDTNSARADIAVLWLERDLIFSPSVQPIRLPKQNEVIVHGAILYLAGWGYTSDNHRPETSRKLKSVAINIISNKRCNIAYDGFILSDMLCASVKDYKKDARMGDSGGGLVIGGSQPTQIGIVSWGKPNKPGVYTRVASYVNWIKCVV